MIALMIAPLIIWLGVFGYLAYLDAKVRQL